jgi:SAM-dependent methyltransferase
MTTDSTPVAASHDWGSAPDFYGPRHSYRESLMLRRLLPLLPGPRVLNVGCGAGSLTLAMLERGLQVSSVDASESFVERVGAQVARRFPTADAPVLTADAHRLPFGDAVFDAVVCGEVLEHLDDDKRAAAEIARVLVPGGLALVSVPAGPRRFDWVDEWAGHRRRYAAAELAGLLKSAGFHDVVVRAWGFPVTAVYERLVYKPLLRRRLARDGGAGDGLGAPHGVAARITPVVRAAMEVDTIFGNHGVFHPGYIAWGRKGSS